MKTMNFKIYSLLIAVSAFLALSGCGSSSSSPVTQIADAGTSTVTANPVSILADGTTTSTITVAVNDGNSDPITDATVSLEDDTNNSIISSVTNVGDGTYTFTVKSSTPETVTYTATADGVEITATASVTFEQTEAQCLLAAGGYETIVINGRTWLDRNLGASQAATDTNDSAAYGDLYQWGRFADGHQERNSTECTDFAQTLDNQDDNTTAWYGQFIVAVASPWDWVDTGVDNNGSLRSTSWSNIYDEKNNPNQVCPCGYRVPTLNELEAMENNITDVAEFKLAYAGWRDTDGTLMDEDIIAIFWTNEQNASTFIINEDVNGTGDTNREAYGHSVRCIKPVTVP